MLVGLVATTAAMSGCSVEEALRFGWPVGVTPQSRDMTHLWSWSVIAALILGVLVWGLMFWTITFHRKKADSPEFPKQTGYNNPIELACTIIPLIVVCVLFYFTVVVQLKVTKLEPNPPVVVDVSAFQWNWRFAYRTVTLQDGTKLDLEIPGPYGEQGVPGEPKEVPGEEHPEVGPNNGRYQEIRDYLRFSSVETQGSSAVIPVLVLPTNTRIEFDLASADVVHSFFVPQFAFKRDVLPNPQQNHTQQRFQITEIDREGAFVGRCAEMCGTYHSMMNFEIRAVTPAKFAQYIAARKDQGLDTQEALTAIGEQPFAITTAPFETKRTGGKASGVGDGS